MQAQSGSATYNDARTTTAVLPEGAPFLPSRISWGAIIAGAVIASVNVVEIAFGFEVATPQAALGGSCRVSLVGAGLSISPIASRPM